MISSISTGKPNVDRASDRVANSTDSEREWSNYYAALLRHVQAHQAEGRVASFALGITSCGRGEGVTTIAINLAIVAARSDSRRVLLVDANSRHPAVVKYLGLKSTVGLTDVLGGGAMLGDGLQSTSIDGLSVLSAGTITKQFGSDYQISDLVDFVDELKSEFELIIFDLPQAEELSECYAFAGALDGIFLVLEAGRVDMRIARRVRQRLDYCQANVLGAIYNKQK
jgi:protein-tyrosine kinase